MRGRVQGAVAQLRLVRRIRRGHQRVRGDGSAGPRRFRLDVQTDLVGGPWGFLQRVAQGSALGLELDVST